MSARIDAVDDRIAVIGVDGVHVMWADDCLARELLRAGQVTLVRRRGRTRVLQAVAGYRKPWEVRLLGRGTALDRTRYSHKRETQENPPRVWTFARLAQVV